MSAKTFGQFLLEHGIVTREQLLDATQLQKTINIPICALALQKHLLSEEQVRQLEEEHSVSDRDFMEIALRRGMLSFDQLEELSRTQSERWMSLGEALARKNLITLSRMEALFEEYRKSTPPEDLGLSESLGDLPEKDLVQAFLEVTMNLFLHYTQQMPHFLSVESVAPDPEDVSYLFSQEVVAADRDFVYALAMGEDLAKIIAMHMAGERFAEMDAMVLDTVSEFVNVIVGHGCIKLNIQDVQITARPPQIMLREMVQRILPAEAISVRLATAEDEFRVVFFFANGKKVDAQLLV